MREQATKQGLQLESGVSVAFVRHDCIGMSTNSVLIFINTSCIFQNRFRLSDASHVTWKKYQKLLLLFLWHYIITSSDIKVIYIVWARFWFCFSHCTFSVQMYWLYPQISEREKLSLRRKKIFYVYLKCKRFANIFW